MPLPIGMSLQFGGAKALGKTGVGVGGVMEGRWNGCWKGFQRWKGLLEGCQKGAGCTCGSLVAKWKCEVGAHLGLSCALRCLFACLLCVLYAR